MHVDYDAAVIGAGPAGSVFAARLASFGHRVLVLERTRFPRFSIGESLLPHSMPVLEALGLYEPAHALFLPKHGACFHQAGTGRIAQYEFKDAFAPPTDHAFEVPRDTFDAWLAERAAANGAEIRFGERVVRARASAGERGVIATESETGSSNEISARLIVDASGRSTLLPRTYANVSRIAGLDTVALYRHVEGAARGEGEREGDIQIIVTPDGWVWLIPFLDGRTSTGAVVKNTVLRELGGMSPAERLDALIARAEPARELLCHAKPISDTQTVADFSYEVTRRHGDGWIAIGDSGGFIDPLFSTGVHLALIGALLAADATHEALSARDVSRARFDAWASDVARGTSTCLGAVRGFYDGKLAEYLFADPQHPYLRRAITSLLAGDVFRTDDERWLKDMRARFPAG